MANTRNALRMGTAGRPMRRARGRGGSREQRLRRVAWSVGNQSSTTLGSARREASSNRETSRAGRSRSFAQAKGPKHWRVTVKEQLTEHTASFLESIFQVIRILLCENTGLTYLLTSSFMGQRRNRNEVL